MHCCSANGYTHKSWCPTSAEPIWIYRDVDMTWAVGAGNNVPGGIAGCYAEALAKLEALPREYQPPSVLYKFTRFADGRETNTVSPNGVGYGPKKQVSQTWRLGFLIGVRIQLGMVMVRYPSAPLPQDHCDYQTQGELLGYPNPLTGLRARWTSVGIEQDWFPVADPFEWFTVPGYEYAATSNIETTDCPA